MGNDFRAFLLRFAVYAAVIFIILLLIAPKAC